MDVDRKGLTGLKNLGNTCFLNSCIQILKHIPELTTLLRCSAQNNIIDNVILTEWISLEKDLWTDNTIVSPNRFVSKVQIVSKKKSMDLFTGWAQNDMPEFLLFIIECLHNSISRPVKISIHGQHQNDVDKKAIICYKMIKEYCEKSYSEVLDIFYAVYISEIFLLDESQSLSIKPEYYFILDLPIPIIDRTIILTDCFDELTKKEILDGENSWYNEDKKKYQSVNKKLSFWSLPKILVITFKRFSPCGTKKNEVYVEFPVIQLNLSKYITGYNPEKYIYNLFGVCNHFGGFEGGHYTSCAQSLNKKWVHYNDSDCNIIHTKDVVSKFAYCLFYRIDNNL